MRGRAVRTLARGALVAGGLVALALLSPRDQTALAAGGNSITTPDALARVQWTSLELDASGNPVVAYTHVILPVPPLMSSVKLLHCNDTSCAGDDESIVTIPDPYTQAGWVGVSLALDTSGFPVLAYQNRVVHCNDANCAGGDDTMSALSTGGFTALVLDADGHPVITQGTTSGLDLVHCNDPDCLGGDESTEHADATPYLMWTSLALDAAGKPVVAYYDSDHQDLKVLACDDVDCVPGGDTITSPDTIGDVGSWPMIALDALGNPVISYRDATNDDLKMLHCNDRGCSGGGDSITSPDTSYGAGWTTSLMLDSSGDPVVASVGPSILHCNDPDCADGETIVLPDPDGDLYTSLALDPSGNPVVSYSRDPAGLKVLHCVNVRCDVLDLDVDGCTNTAESGGDPLTGGLRNPKLFWDFFDTPDSSNVRDKAVAGTDFFRLLARFNSTGSASIDPLAMPPPAPAYHTAFDRGPSSGPNPWNLTAANGAIAGTDFFAMLAQFGHSCA